MKNLFVFRNVDSQIEKFEECLAKAKWSKDYLDKVRVFKEELKKPCVIAVVGQVSAGKSTFVNALLEDERLAKVGRKETTSILTYYKYGNKSEDHAVGCIWKDGKITMEKLNILDEIYGIEDETLKKMKDISHLEVFLNKEILKDITIVDTPGTGSNIKEHENRTQDVIKKHTFQTEKLTREATAIIYLVGIVGNSEEKKQLESFRQATNEQSNSLNAIGVMSKIDLYPQTFRNPDKVIKKLSEQLKDELSAVVPVSAGLYTFLKKNNKDTLSILQKKLKQIPSDCLDFLLSDSDAFTKFYVPECPFNIEERIQLLNESSVNINNWTIFQQIAESLVTLSLDDAIQELKTLSGFQKLMNTLKKHFLNRAKLLTYYRVVSEIFSWVKDLEWELKELQEIEKNNLDKRRRYISFLRGFNSTIAKELESFVNKDEVFGTEYEKSTSVYILDVFKTEIEKLLVTLTIINEDFYAASQLLENSQEFTDEELKELSKLFKRYSNDWSEIAKELDISNQKVAARRYLYWNRVSLSSKKGSTKNKLSRIAMSRYSSISNYLKIIN